MIENISSLFHTFSTATATLVAFKEILKGKKGDSRAFLEEVKENAGFCWLVMEHGTDPLKIIPELKTAEYDRIIRTEYRFNTLNRKKIRAYRELDESGLSYFKGKDTAQLVENIYDRIKDLKRIYRMDKSNKKIRWGVRVHNLQKRILLLLKHLMG